MGLVDRFTSLWSSLVSSGAKTTSDELAAETGQRSSEPLSLMRRFQSDQARRDVIKTSRRMYEQDPRIYGVLLTLARDATKGGFVVDVAGGSQAARAQQVADELVDRIRLNTVVDEWFRLTLRDGDLFLELGVDEEGIVQQVTRKPTLEMRRNSNAFDLFDDPARAFWWSDQPWMVDPEQGGVWFPEWMIIHARWARDIDSRYGRPLFASATGAWKRVAEGETDMAVRRKTRAGMRYVHVLPGADEATITKYKRMNSSALNNPTAAIADFFTNVEGGIKAVQGDARLGEIGDIMHHIRTLWLASPVPMSLLGYGQDLNRDVLEEQGEQYERALETISAWVIDEVVRPLVERQWLLRGLLPESLEYEIRRMYKRPVTAADIREVAQAVLVLQGTGLLTDDILLNLITSMLPIDAQQAAEALAAARAGQADEVTRMERLATA